MVDHLRKDLELIADPIKAKHSNRFFKTEKGHYGYGDLFIGVTVPQSRIIAQKYHYLSLPDLRKLLLSTMHEERLIALFILVDQFNKGEETTRKEIYDFYVAHMHRVNNWDLVDSSAHKIVGQYLLDKPRDILYVWAKSSDLWEKRIAIIATYWFIKQGQFDDTLAIAKILLHDSHDLIHKAVGWMLREVGNRDKSVEEAFLKVHYNEMPRTMLRYAVEKFPEQQRRAYIEGTI